MWLTGDTTHSTSHVHVATSKLSLHCLCYISDIVSTTDVMGRDFQSRKLFYVHVTGVYAPRHWASLQKFSSASWSAALTSAAVRSENTE